MFLWQSKSATAPRMQEKLDLSKRRHIITRIRKGSIGDLGFISDCCVSDSSGERPISLLLLNYLRPNIG